MKILYHLLFVGACCVQIDCCASDIENVYIESVYNFLCALLVLTKMRKTFWNHASFKKKKERDIFGFLLLCFFPTLS